MQIQSREKSVLEKILRPIPWFFFFSGLTGLIYEIVWTRMLVKVIGGAPFAVSIVLTVFMGGIGLGSYLAGRLVDGIRPPSRLVRIYGWLELTIAGFALLIPPLLTAVRPVQSFLYNHLYHLPFIYHSLTFAACACLLLVPVICMGATLPLLCRFWIEGLSRLGAKTGALYGLNTIGGALGALACGFWAIGSLGVPGTVLAAVLVNAAIGAACLFLSFRAERFLRREPARISDESAASEEEEIKPPPARDRKTARLALVIFAVSGFCAMAYEVILTKLLELIVGPTTYSLTVVLVTFISGLALGGFLFGRLADLSGDPFRILLWTQIGAGLMILGVSQLLGNSQLFFAKLIYQFQDNFSLLSFSKFAALFALLLWPTLCLGGAFPLVGKICTRSFSRLGRSLGFAYSINTAGAVLGSFGAGFILIPLLGKENGLSAVAALQTAVVLAAAGLLWKIGGRRAKWIPIGTAALLGISLSLFYPRWNHELLSSSKYHRLSFFETGITGTGWFKSLLRGGEVLEGLDSTEYLFSGDGVGGFTTVSQTPDVFGNRTVSMAISGKIDASSRKDMKTQTLLAHFAMLFHEKAKSVMVVGLASGVTAGEALLYPVEKLDVLEINRQVVEASRFFESWNNRVLDDPRTHVIVQDARAHLQLTRKTYDVIISEPSNPWMSGLAALFTLENFRQTRARLNPGGIFVQWFHSYDMDWATFSMVGRTFARVFPNSLLVSTGPFPYGNDFLLIGFNGEKRISLAAGRKNLPYLQKSTNVTLTDPILLFRLIVSEDLGEVFGPGPVNTDNRPRLEFASPKLIDTKGEEILDSLRSKARLSRETRGIVREASFSVDRQIDFARYALSLYMPFPDMVDLERATPEQKERFFRFMEAYCAENPMDLSYLEDDGLLTACISTQIVALEGRISDLPDKAGSYFYLGNLYYAVDLIDEAIHNYRLSLQAGAGGSDVHFYLGSALIRQNRFEEAARCFRNALNLKPNFPTARRSLGFSLASQGLLDEAARELSRAVLLSPRDHTLHNDLGVLLFQLGRKTEAVAHFERALRLKPDYADAEKNLEIARGR